MAKITNTSTRASRGIPDGDRIVELTPGATHEMQDANWAAIKDRASIAADVQSGFLLVRDFSGDDASAASADDDAEVKAKKPKAAKTEEKTAA